MSEIQISLVASAVRIGAWERFYNSLKGNTINWEVIFIGNKSSSNSFPDNFRWINASVKPAQCYEIGFRAAKGELIHWTADDADYLSGGVSDCLDIAYNFYRSFNNYKIIVALRPIENGNDVWKFHRFFGRQEQTPMMAPFGLISNQFMKELGGYDKNFISGQSENDLIMRAIERGGKVEICLDAKLWVHHYSTHDRPNLFRKYYTWDRQILENAWVPAGYGTYTNKNQSWNPTIISSTRLIPYEPFEETKDWLIKSQGAKGDWE